MHRPPVLSPPSSPGDPTLISAEQLATILGMSKRTVWRLLSARQLPTPVRIGHSTRWRLDDVRRWIDSGCPTGDNYSNTACQSSIGRRRG